MFRLPAGTRAVSTSKEFSLRTPLKVSVFFGSSLSLSLTSITIH